MNNVVTLYHRATNDSYPEVCDAATTAVVSISDNSDAGFIGAVWGVHSPTACINVAHIEQTNFLAQLQQWGLQLKQDPS